MREYSKSFFLTKKLAYFLACALFFVSFSVTFATVSVPQINWNKLFVNQGPYVLDDESYDVKTDSEGSVYVSGSVRDFFSRIQYPVLLKYSQSGNFLWQKKLTAYPGFGDSIFIDSQNNIYQVLQLSQDTASAGPTRIVKYDQGGNILSTFEYIDSVTPNKFKPTGIAVDASGNIYITGWHQRPFPYQGIFISQYFAQTVKFNSSGSLQWEREDAVNHWTMTEPFSVAVDSSGNIIVVGRENMLVNKYDPAGNMLWKRTYPSLINGYAFGVATDAQNNIYVTGEAAFYNHVDGSAKPTRQYYGYDENVYDMYTFKLSSSGAFIWGKQEDGGAAHGAAQSGCTVYSRNITMCSELGSRVVVDPQGNILVFGRAMFWDGTQNVTKFGLTKYTSAGNVLWRIYYASGNLYDAGQGVALDSAGNIDVTGLSFNPSGSSTYDIRTIQYGQVTDEEPIAVARIGKNGGALGSTVSVFQGENATINLDASQSSDADGWTNAKGVSSGGSCGWTSSIALGFSQTISNPASAAGCNTNHTRIFNIAGTFTYTLKITDNLGAQSAPSNVTIVVNPETTPPTTPSSVTASAVSGYCDRIKVSWLASTDSGSGVKQYNVYRVVGATNTKIATVPVGTLTYTDVGLSGSTAYSYKVEAEDNAGNRAMSAAVSATTNACPDVTPPSTPTGVTATVQSCTSVSIRWNASTDNVGIAGYNVYRNGIKINSSLVVGTTYTDSAASQSSTYTYTVRAVDIAANLSAVSSGASAITGACPDTTPPTKPGNVSVTVLSCSSVRINWSASSDGVGGSGVKGYNVYRDGIKINGSLIVGTTYTDSALTENTTYSYRVEAVDVANNISQKSTAVSATTGACADTIPPSKPTGVTATVLSCNSVRVNWNASTDNVGVAGYNVYRNGIQLNGSLVIGTTYTDATAVQSTTYTYTVKAVDAAGNSSAVSSGSLATTGACIVAKPDLVVSISPWRIAGTPDEGQPLTFMSIVKNQGQVDTSSGFSNGFYVDLNNDNVGSITLSGGSHADVFISSGQALSPLGVGQVVSVTNSMPWTAVAGTHRIIVCADDPNTVSESDENNNCSTSVGSSGTGIIIVSRTILR